MMAADHVALWKINLFFCSFMPVAKVDDQMFFKIVYINYFYYNYFYLSNQIIKFNRIWINYPESRRININKVNLLTYTAHGRRSY